MTDFLDPLTAWPCSPPPGYRGQLDPDFQRRRASLYSKVTLDDCTWYHTTELADGTITRGEWDLRGGESVYLGEVDLANKSVLEFGPASGYLSFWMEAQGARVTSFEVGYDAVVAFVPPVVDEDLEAAQTAGMDHVRRTTNAWWYLHRMRESSARLVHGDLYRLPDDLGNFDVTTFASILLHVRDPFLALQQAAAHTTERIIVVESLPYGLEGDLPILEFGTHPAHQGSSFMWWLFSPGMISMMLWRLGFERTKLIHHTQHYTTPDGQKVEPKLFTIVADRTERARLEKVPSWFPAAQQEAIDLKQVSEELKALRSTRTFRWTAPLRRLYGALR